MRANEGWVGRMAIFAGGAALLLNACAMPRTIKTPIIAVAPVCADFTVDIYFDAQSAALTREARDLVDAAARRARACQVTGVSVVGLADAPGDPRANLALSRRRADAVTRILAHRGLTQVAFQVAAVGDSGAETRSGEAKPLRRRAVVQFHLTVAPSARR